MIDFRYHLVSIVAVFLALAIGIVLGSTELRGKVVNALQSTSNSLSSELNAAQHARDSYAAQVAADQTFAATNEQALLKRLLAGERVELITEPGFQDSVVAGIEKAAHYADATITGTIALQSKFNDTTGATESALNSLNSNLTPSGTTLTTGSNQQTVNQQQAVQLMAMATVTKSSASSTLSSAQDVLSGYAQAGFISVAGQPQDGATMAIIVTPQTAPTDGSSDPANQVLVAVAQEFASASAGTVVAGNVSGAGSGSAMSVLRSSSVSGQVSSIDNADTTVGQIVAIQALARQVQGGKPEAYGVESGASTAGPSPAPTPSASVSASASPTSTKKAKG
jgi:hypothetical protein